MLLLSAVEEVWNRQMTITNILL